MNAITINLTPTEADAWNWAQDAAAEYWSPVSNNDRGDGLNFEEPVMLPAQDGIGVIIDHPDVIEDVIYRLTEQLVDSSEGHHFPPKSKERMDALRTIKAAKSVAAKIKATQLNR